MSAPLFGARRARPNRLRRLAAGAMARDLRAFVVPGPDVARARGLDLRAAGLALVDTPRHAGVLVLVGELPAGLAKAAAVAYAQMPRPRAVLGVGPDDAPASPEPDVSVGWGDLRRGVAGVRRLFAEGAFDPRATDFDVDEIRTETGYVCPMHPGVVRDEPGACPVCGTDLVPRESAGGGDLDHAQTDGEDQDPQAEDKAPGHPEAEEAGGADHGEPGGADPGGEGGADADNGSMDHGSHDDMGFMSMVEMTRDLPRSPDGLPMEWVEVPFGPLLPGLPAGLSLKLTLDGDAVAEAEAEPGVKGWASRESLARPAEGFAGRLARLDPHSPVAYRVLAWRALEDAAGAAADERTRLARAGALERERAASHLGWLSGFAHLMGYGRLEERAAKLQLALLGATDPEEVSRLVSEVSRLSRRAERTPLLGRKLAGIGRLPEGSGASGPVARAGGVAADARAEEEIYRRLGFEPVVLDGDDALARLRVRLAETQRSLGLVRKIGPVSAPEATPVAGASGAGSAVVETPRGTARLRVAIEGGVVTDVRLDAPSARHLALVGAVAGQRELADALVGIASLDLSPWEILV